MVGGSHRPNDLARVLPPVTVTPGPVIRVNQPRTAVEFWRIGAVANAGIRKECDIPKSRQVFAVLAPEVEVGLFPEPLPPLHLLSSQDVAIGQRQPAVHGCRRRIFRRSVVRRICPNKQIIPSGLVRGLEYSARSSRGRPGKGHLDANSKVVEQVARVPIFPHLARTHPAVRCLDQTWLPAT